MSGVTQTPQRRRSSYLAAFSTVRSRKVAPPRTQLSDQERCEMQEVAAHSWRVFFMSPLWSVSIANAKQFETLLLKLKKLVKKTLDEMPEHRGLKVTTSSLTSIAEVLPAIRLTVSAAGRRAPLAELLFCSAEAVLRALPDEVVGDCVCLPLVLARGSAAVRDTVLGRLRSAYGSNFVAPGFLPDDMRWMASMWAARPGFESDSDVVLEYLNQVAGADAGLRSVTVRLSGPDMSLIHASVHGSSPVMTREAMDTFHRVLSKVGEDAVGLPLNLFDLHSFVTPLARVHSDGQIKFGSAEAVNSCLTFLRQLASEFFDP